MRFDVVTIFPDIFDSFLGHSILKRALDGGVIEVNLYDLRDFTRDPHRQVDDEPYGGGAGMVMKPEPFFEAVLAITGSSTPEEARSKGRIILLSPKGPVFSQSVALSLAACGRLILLCGRYEGVDERVAKYLAAEELSVGDYILSGGEVAGMAVVDAVARLVPGVVGRADSLTTESFSENLLEYPQYTRPRDYSGLAVPDILLSGDHRRIDAWRRDQAVAETARRRRDLLEKGKALDNRGKDTRKKEHEND